MVEQGTAASTPMLEPPCLARTYVEAGDRIRSQCNFKGAPPSCVLASLLSRPPSTLTTTDTVTATAANVDTYVKELQPKKGGTRHGGKHSYA